MTKHPILLAGARVRKGRSYGHPIATKNHTMALATGSLDRRPLLACGQALYFRRQPIPCWRAWVSGVVTRAT